MNAPIETQIELKNSELEADVLSAFIRVPNAIFESHEVERTWFYGQSHRLIFDALQHAVSVPGFNWNHVPALVEQRIENTVTFDVLGPDEVSGRRWFNALLGRVISEAQPWRVWVMQLRELYLRRATLQLGRELCGSVAQPLEDESSFDEVVSRFVSEAGDLCLLRTGEDETPASDAETYLERVRSAAAGEVVSTISSTHITAWDKLTGGVTYGRFVIVAAKPKHGKTSIILRAVFNLMHIENYACDFYSGEMSRHDIVDLLGVMASGYRREEFAKGEAAPGADVKGRDTIASLDYRLFTGRKHVREIENNTRARVAQLGEKKLVVVVDYLQLFRGDGESRTEVIENISMRLAALSHELPCLVIAAAQFRKVEGEPKVVELFGSGQLEKDANELFIWYRPCLDAPNPTPDLLRVGKLILARNRHGEMGVENVDADLAHLRFQVPAEAF